MNRDDFNDFLESLLRAFPGTSDLVLVPGRRPLAQVDGELLEGAGATLSPSATAVLADLLIGGARAMREAFESTGACDCPCGLPSGTRLRANVFRARSSISIVMRVLPAGVPTLAQFGLPAAIGQVAALRDGLVLVTGATGSGKSTTLAAVLGIINGSRPVHVVTLEDPVEFAHPPLRATVSQRELGTDFPTFAAGLRSALRQSPAVIMVGELRDPETVEIGLKAAETGHLVLTTMHSIDAGQAIGRLVGVFNPSEQRLVRSRLAEVLRFVVSQRLLPRAEGGRVAAVEIMGQSLRVRELVREGEGAGATLRRAIAEGRSYGWQTFDQHILELYAAGIIGVETAVGYASDRSEVSRGIDQVRSAHGLKTSSLGTLEMDRPTDQPRR